MFIEIVCLLKKNKSKKKFAMSIQYLKKEVRDEVDFLHANKHKNFLQVDFNMGHFYKVIVSLLMDMI